MTTKDIERIFGLSNYQPPRELKSDVEILNHVANCYNMTKLFEKESKNPIPEEGENLP